MTNPKQLLTKTAVLTSIIFASLTVEKQAAAVTFVSNLTETNLGAITLDFGLWNGSNFTTGNGSYTLDSVNVLLAENTNTSNFFLSLYSDNGKVPDSNLTSFTPTAPISSNLAVNDFNPNSIVQLAANTTYWLVGGVSEDDGGDYAWGITSSSNETGIDGWTIGNGFIRSNDQGESWNVSPINPLQFSVDATALNASTTPEPSSLVALLGLGGLGLASRLKKGK